MKKNMKKLVVVAGEFAGHLLFTRAVGDLAAALKERTDSQALRCLIDIGSGVVVGLHAASCGGRVDSRLNRIEAEAGRERRIHWGPRTLDLDIIFYDDRIVEESGLCIPHVDMHKRKFVLEPLAQIAPYKRHPVYGKTVKEMLEDLQCE